MALFALVCVDALNAEIDDLIGQILADEDLCPECGGLCLDPFVDINPDRIPHTDARSRDRVDQFLDRQDTTVLPTNRLRIVCASAGVAENTARLLRALGAPEQAIYLGGY